MISSQSAKYIKTHVTNSLLLCSLIPINFLRLVQRSGAGSRWRQTPDGCSVCLEKGFSLCILKQQSFCFVVAFVKTMPWWSCTNNSSYPVGRTLDRLQEVTELGALREKGVHFAGLQPPPLPPPLRRPPPPPWLISHLSRGGVLRCISCRVITRGNVLLQ